MKKQFSNQLLKPLLFLAALILVCSFLSHTFANSETIVDYVNKNQKATAEESKTQGTDAVIDMSVHRAYEKIEKMQADNAAYQNVSESETAYQTEASYKAETAHIDVIKEESEGENTSMAQTVSADRTVYKEGFYYEPLSEEIKAKITGISYPISASEAAASAVPVVNILDDDTVPAVSYDDLRYLSVLYYDFNGEVQTGELICNKGIADDLMEIFHELYLNEYQIEKIRLVDEYKADDTASITDNNTSCFNYRVVDGTTSLSKHALGCAIDINPFYNPYVVFNKDGSGETYISPPGSEIYVDRSKDFPYKIDESDLCYKLFKEHGFTWGGNWNSCKDYQHFQKVLN